MKKNYETPDIELIRVASEEIMLLSLSQNSTEGEEVNWEDWTN